MVMLLFQISHQAFIAITFTTLMLNDIKLLGLTVLERLHNLQQ